MIKFIIIMEMKTKLYNLILMVAVICKKLVHINLGKEITTSGIFSGISMS